jgi:hypothetical protein
MPVFRRALHLRIQDLEDKLAEQTRLTEAADARTRRAVAAHENVR